MCVEFINPFIEASQFVFTKTALMNIELGNIADNSITSGEDQVGIHLGVTGKIRGQVIFTMKRKVACELAAQMMRMGPVKDLDDISKSAVKELANIIMGRTASILSNQGYKIDITPPCLLFGDNLKFLTARMKTVYVPFILENNMLIEAEIAVA